jgi:hypothetical protein
MATSSRPDDTNALAALLTDPRRRVAAAAFPRPADDVDLPGLYAWFVDTRGAADLSKGLGHRIEPGLIYAGQTGAGTGSATLRSRVGRNHIRGNIRGSTFRLTLAAVLAGPIGLVGAGGRALASDGESRLGDWIVEHVSVSVAPLQDRLVVRILEAAVLARLDPPLNLEGMPASSIRSELSRRRSELTSVARAPRETPARRPPLHGGSGSPVPMRREPSPSGGAPDISTHLAGLVGRTLPTMTGKPNKIVRLDGGVVWVGTDTSPDGQPVDIAEVQDAANALYAKGELRIDVPTVGHRSAFVGAVLSTLSGTSILLNPRRIVLARRNGQ